MIEEEVEGLSRWNSGQHSSAASNKQKSSTDLKASGAGSLASNSSNGNGNSRKGVYCGGKGIIAKEVSLEKSRNKSNLVSEQSDKIAINISVLP